MTVYAYIQDARVLQLVQPQITDIDILQPDESGVLVVVVGAGQVVPLPMLYTPEFLAELQEVPAGQVVEPGDSYVGGVFGPPPAPPEPAPLTAAEALAQRDALLATAALRIDPLADAVELDDATPAEVAALKAWRQYRVALNRIEQQAGFPASVVWPVKPT